MKDAFYKLNEIKQKQIVNACIQEFSSKKYDQCSLNTIIKNAGISKGGLFKYISSKEELYLYVMEMLMNELITYQISNISNRTDCYIERIREMSNLAIDYYETHNNAYKAILIALIDRQSIVYGALEKLRASLMERHKSKLLYGIDWTQYRLDAKELSFVVGCALSGYNLELLEQMNTAFTLQEFKEKINGELDMILDVLKVGVCNEI